MAVTRALRGFFNNKSYTVALETPFWPSAERYFIFLLFLIFALCERKMRNNIIVKYHAAAGYQLS
jgi:hypothetical protein